jgi:hypothetical protein
LPVTKSHFRSGLAALLLAASAAPVAAAAVRVDFDPEARFAEYRTFRFITYGPDEKPPTGVISNPGLREQFEARFGAALERHGLKRAKPDEEADLVVRWWTGLEEAREADRINGYGLYVDGYWSSIYSLSVKETVGKLLFVVDLIDARERDLAWRAYLLVKATDPVRTRDRLAKQIERALDQYPPDEADLRAKRAARPN